MADQKACCDSNTVEDTQCCRVEAVVSVDARGQMVLPKELRERAKIRPGDKLALTSFQRDGEIYCIMMTKAEDLSNLVLQSIGPAMKVVLDLPETESNA